MERAPGATGRELSLGDAGLGQDPLGIERDERVQYGLEPLAAPEQRLAKLDGRERPLSQPGAELRDPEEAELDVAQRRIPPGWGMASPSTTFAPGIRWKTSGAMRILPFRPPVPRMTQSRSMTRAST